MNVFIIPSWYPSEDEPHTGIFFKEQAEALADVFPDSDFALSTWGSHEHDLLLYSNDLLKIIPKLIKGSLKQAAQTQLRDNLTQYYTPAFTWTRKVWQGNIRNIIKANEKHLLAFKAAKGTIDVIHAHSAHPGGWVAMELSKKYNIPYVLTEHMGPFPFDAFKLPSGKLSPWLAKPLHNAFATIAVSPQQQATLQNWGIPRVTHIPNLTDESFFKPDKGKQPNTAFTFFTLARLEEGKGISYLLEAFKKLLEVYQECKLIIGGEGSQQENYKARANALAISDNVELLGVLNRDQALQAYQRCDAFVLPSLHENLPLVLLEAIACGKPLISTYCGGPESIITPETGILVAPGNTEALYEGLLAMHLNYKHYNPDKIRQLFLIKYSRQTVCQQIMDIYKAASVSKN
ncbi:glycosyltransferase [Pontibacter fetidus]|uniref:Glycosyltransferase family 4 protein n=1 Tax=Pontibacter fetidus TaxID=2700082 RepID=A0A6B2HA93_9BACT|nr:glycosyltransferase [Pontibacter fetidus]NDK57200.1 glycosyltransferase family 4 protein [Pontibacter fetidus]